MPKINIDEVYTKDSIGVMHINFQNGYTTDSFTPQKCVLLDNEKTGKKFIATEINDTIYAGEEEEEDIGKTFVLAKNRKTGKVKLIEVGFAELKPVLKVEDEETHNVDMSNLELSRKFGSKKQKQQMEQREKLKVNVETVKEQMLNVTVNISEDKLDLSTYNKTDSDDFYIPPIDRSASKPEDVYEINKILSEEQFERIYSELEDKDYKTDLLPIVKNIVSGKKMSVKHTVLAVYASALLKLYTSIMKDMSRKGFVAYPHSNTLNEIILSNFFTMSNGRRSRPNPYKDKSLCYAMVFLLIINNLKFELDALCKDAKLTANNASIKVRVTGATVINSGSKKVVQLKLPLNTKSGFRRKSAKF